MISHQKNTCSTQPLFHPTWPAHDLPVLPDLHRGKFQLPRQILLRLEANHVPTRNDPLFQNRNWQKSSSKSVIQSSSNCVDGFWMISKKIIFKVCIQSLFKFRSCSGMVKSGLCWLALASEDPLMSSFCWLGTRTQRFQEVLPQRPWRSKSAAFSWVSGLKSRRRGELSTGRTLFFQTLWVFLTLNVHAIYEVGTLVMRFLILEPRILCTQPFHNQPSTSPRRRLCHFGRGTWLRLVNPLLSWSREQKIP